MTKKIIDNIPILSIILIYFGYCNLYFYFKEFKIEVYNYISNSEILLSFLPTIVILGATFGYLIISLVINHNQLAKNEENKSAKTQDIEVTKKTEIEIDKQKSKKISFDKSILKSPIFICGILSIFFVLLNFYLKNQLNFKNYELKNYSLITSFTTPILYYYLLIEYGNEFLKKYSFFIALSIIVFIGNQIGGYRKCEAEEIKDGISDIQISFTINNKEIKTNRDLLLIGQTQSTIFLYDRINKSSFIFNRDKLEKLIIK